MFDLSFRSWIVLLCGWPLIPFAYYMFQRTTSTMQYSSVEIVDHVPRSLRSRLLIIPAILMALGTAAFLISLAGPRTANKESIIRRDGIAIMMVVDRSSSMNARDLVQDDHSVDRLTVVKDVFQKFVLGDTKDAGAGRPDDLVGLVTFAGFADSICPLTYDHNNLTSLVKDLQIVTNQSEDGTAMGDGLALAVERLRKSKAKSRVAILLTDGVNNAGVIEPLKAAELAADNDVKVYAIGAGTEGRAPIPVRDPFTGRMALTAARVEIDEKTLQAVAEKTAGRYFRATDASALAEIYQQIDKLERTEVSQERYLDYDEHYQIALMVGLFLVVTSIVMDRTIFRQLP